MHFKINRFVTGLWRHAKLLKPVDLRLRYSFFAFRYQFTFSFLLFCFASVPFFLLLLNETLLFLLLLLPLLVHRVDGRRQSWSWNDDVFSQSESVIYSNRFNSWTYLSLSFTKINSLRVGSLQVEIVRIESSPEQLERQSVVARRLWSEDTKLFLDQFVGNLLFVAALFQLLVDFLSINLKHN